ncbi:MAG: cofactor-independent phosphoglycerate mutase [Clostridiales bacterium]|nr:cofactor-independent phosphoglycerate mutase [Clostridiales bacterium]
MKYAIVLYDGMADLPVPALGGKTPMQVAKKPIFDSLAARAEVGLIKTVPDGLKPGSDIANLSVLGYDPAKYYTGRSPLEAVSIGVQMLDSDISLRCNLVTLSDEEAYEDKTMLDYSAGDISSAEAAELIKSVQEYFGNEIFTFYSGVSYRHCLIFHEGTLDLGDMTPPHDISNRVVGPYLSQSENAKELIAMMKASYDLLKDHPINQERRAKGKQAANSIWLWGEGKRPSLPAFEELYNVKGSIISAVDLLKGIGICAKMATPHVEGVTGYIDTNFKGKAAAAVDEWARGQDLVYLHIEAPDECGHRNEPENKVRSIELIDEQVLPILLEYLEKQDEYKLLILPDHPTPIVTGTHSSDPVPYMIYTKNKPLDAGLDSINELTAKTTGNFIEHGPGLMAKFLGADQNG